MLFIILCLLTLKLYMMHLMLSIYCCLLMYLRTVQGHICNKAHVEVLIKMGHLAYECLTFYSRYMNAIDTTFNTRARNNDDDESSLTDKLELFIPLE